LLVTYFPTLVVHVGPPGQRRAAVPGVLLVVDAHLRPAPGLDGSAMSRRSLDPVDLVELFLHWQADRSQVQISESLGLDRKTVPKYLAPAVADGLTPGDPASGEAVWAQRVARWFPQITDGRLPQVTWPAIAAHREYIVGQLQAGVTVSTISARLAAEHGLSAPTPDSPADNSARKRLRDLGAAITAVPSRSGHRSAMERSGVHARG
jgi:hypothetical protein